MEFEVPVNQVQMSNMQVDIGVCGSEPEIPPWDSAAAVG